MHEGPLLTGKSGCLLYTLGLLQMPELVLPGQLKSYSNGEAHERY
jgi:hypothetical protein